MQSVSQQNVVRGKRNVYNKWIRFVTQQQVSHYSPLSKANFFLGIFIKCTNAQMHKANKIESANRWGTHPSLICWRSPCLLPLVLGLGGDDISYIRISIAICWRITINWFNLQSVRAVAVSVTALFPVYCEAKSFLLRRFPLSVSWFVPSNSAHQCAALCVAVSFSDAPCSILLLLALCLS